LVLVLLVSVPLAWFATALPLLSNSSTPLLQEGQVADRDYRASDTATYTSNVMTEQRREIAARSVAPLFTSPDSRVARKQLESLRNVLAYINSVRADPYASMTQKTSDLLAMEDILLEADTVLTLLGMTDSRWQAVQQEALVVMEKIMSSPIRPDGIQDARSRLPALVSLALPESQADVVAALVEPFVTPNSFYSDELTLAAQQAAREQVEPLSRTFVADQVIVFRGEVLDAADIEALQELGFVEPQEILPDLVSISALVLLMAVYMVLYFRRESAEQSRNRRAVPVVSLLFLVFLFGSRLILPSHTVLPYAFPAAAYSLTVAALYGSRLAIISTLPLAILMAYGLPNALELTLFYIMGGLFGVLAVGRARRMASFFWAGIAVAFAGIMTVLVFRLPLPTTDLIGLATLCGACLVNGLASGSITIVLQYALAQFMGMTTPMQLVDLTRPDHPLMQLLLKKAPGTYQHSLQVANLAEQAAESIGADPLLTRVGALYHDVGKTGNPLFFIENQTPGFSSPHETLNGYQSAEIIIRHVTEGLELADRHRLPRAIREFIEQHHGTLTARYQYVQAVKDAGGDESQVDIERFRYPGRIPQSREVAILMLADGCEARVRAERPSNEEQLLEVIKSMVKDRFAKGQLDETNLTFRDLTLIQDSFLSSMRVIYHPRVRYPNEEVSISPDTAPSRGRMGSETPSSSGLEAALPVDGSPKVAHGTEPA
jgi:hypothetical protein